MSPAPRSRPSSRTAANQRPIAEEIAQLRALPVAELVERYTEAFGKPPRVKHREWLWRRVAWKLQEQRFGGLSEVAKRRLDELIAELDIPLAAERKARGKVGGDPPLGTTLVRQYRGREVRATRTPEGWESGGVLYRSLSAVAKAVTGSHVSGPAWFAKR